MRDSPDVCFLSVQVRSTRANVAKTHCSINLLVANALKCNREFGAKHTIIELKLTLCCANN